ncbi:epithelial cell-transforming sequence 2 oncogene-like [Gigantopelta aegis]|uniref:epithelial cell-transforming sequence 2 oncogene-like n=1 Tax=Gigantopelta aegis TaxID=1735272 RepID=UPI001B88B780|nr:epithelial cell-transforming sequence 2 oncogene-like [Gigantopelta aegis]
MEGLEERSKTKKLHTKLTLTQDDDKILGRPTALRREKTLSMDKVATLKMKTHNSAWTPILHKPSNEQIFKERRDLVSHWFDLWTDSQRKRFLDVIFRQCTRGQNRFVIEWFRQHVPMQHLDFVTVLPRFLSLYVFSFLEPKSLCRAAQACWHWKFLADQDAIWIAKCKKYGWFLPYTPADNEYGAWKRHYVACVQTLDYVTGSGKDDLYGTRADGAQYTGKMLRLKGNRLSKSDSRRLMDIRPPWKGPDNKPKDLDKSHFAFLHDLNVNDPLLPKSALVLHNKWGITKHDVDVSKSLDFEVGMDTSRRKERHRALTAGEDYNPLQTNNHTLREVINLENFEEMRMRELVETDWKPPKRVFTRRFDQTGKGGFYSSRQTSKSTTLGGSMMDKNPRVLFISSRVPAADLLLDAVTFGVVPIVYEYEGTSTETLLSQLESILQGRHAQSVGLFCHSEEPGEVRLVHGCTISLDNFDCPESREFFETVSNHILPTYMGGQFDIFVPLAASESGMEFIVQLTVLTEMQFSSPTGIIGSYNHGL